MERFSRAVVDLATATHDVSDDSRGVEGHDAAVGQALAGRALLRRRVNRTLASCVAAIVDSRLSLVGHRSRR